MYSFQAETRSFLFCSKHDANHDAEDADDRRAYFHDGGHVDSGDAADDDGDDDEDGDGHAGDDEYDDDLCDDPNGHLDDDDNAAGAHAHHSAFGGDHAGSREQYDEGVFP